MIFWLITAASLASGAVLGAIEACRSGNGEACRMAGEAYLEGDGVQPDRARAVELFLSACELGVAESCLFLARAYHQGDGLRVDLEHAVELYGLACEHGEAEACRIVGDLHTTGGVEGIDVQRAATWYRLGCDLGDPESCTSAAMGLERGDGGLEFESGAEAEAEAWRLLARACRGDHVDGCARLAWRLDVSAPADALPWFEQACELGDVASCRQLGLAKLSGQHTPRDPQAGVVALDTACRGEDLLACQRLSILFRRSEPAVALDAAQRACGLGDGRSCRRVTRLQRILGGPAGPGALQGAAVD